MDPERSLAWLTDAFGIQDRVLSIDDTRDSVPEWDSLGTLLLRDRLKRDHDIVLGEEQAATVVTVRQLCQILARGPTEKTRGAAPKPAAMPRAGVETLVEGIREQVGSLIGRSRRLLSSLSPRQKSRLRSLQSRVVKKIRSCTPEQLLEALRALGVREGDTVVVHSSFSYSNGFVGSPGRALEVLLESVGSTGNLMMMSLPYTSSTYDYLQSLDHFDVRKTGSRMGLLTEIFREREDVYRSLSPTHPILAWGPEAEWIVAGHETCPHPCGAGTPFEKLAQLEGKVVFFDTSFATMTFFHYIEDKYRHLLPRPLYHPEAFEVPVVDREGRRITVFVYAFSPEIIERRKPHEFESEIRRQGLIGSLKVGNLQLEYIEIGPLLDFVDAMVKRGNLFFYDLS